MHSPKNTKPTYAAPNHITRRKGRPKPNHSIMNRLPFQNDAGRNFVPSDRQEFESPRGFFSRFFCESNAGGLNIPCDSHNNGALFGPRFFSCELIAIALERLPAFVQERGAVLGPIFEDFFSFFIMPGRGTGYLLENGESAWSACSKGSNKRHMV